MGVDGCRLPPTAKGDPMPSKKKTVHYLISAPLIPHAHAHCYLITTNRADTLKAADRMLHEVEKAGATPLGAVMVTELDERVDMVRGIVSARAGDDGKMLREATDFHMTVFCTAKGDREDVALMKIH